MVKCGTNRSFFSVEKNNGQNRDTFGSGFAPQHMHGHVSSGHVSCGAAQDQLICWSHWRTSRLDGKMGEPHRRPPFAPNSVPSFCIGRERLLQERHDEGYIARFSQSSRFIARQGVTSCPFSGLHHSGLGRPDPRAACCNDVRVRGHFAGNEHYPTIARHFQPGVYRKSKPPLHSSARLEPL
jgi:hypothetical protein